MNLKKLLRDATESASCASRRSQCIELADRLNDQTPPTGEKISVKGVSKWFERNSLPSKWLMRIAALRTPPLDLTLYA